MLVSVEIVSGCRVLKRWGLHQVSDTATLSELFYGIVSGTIESGSAFTMPVELQNSAFRCAIANSQKGSFQDCPVSLAAKDATEFAGKHIRFLVDAAEATAPSAERRDISSVLMSSQRQVRFMQPNPNPRNKKEELCNAVVLWLNREEVGFQPADLETRGTYISGVITDVLWVIDGHSSLLQDIDCESQDQQLLGKVFVRANLSCGDKIEVPYYSCGNYEPICIYCGLPDNLVSGDAATPIYPTCTDCFSQYPKAFRRKRNLMAQCASKSKRQAKISNV